MITNIHDYVKRIVDKGLGEARVPQNWNGNKINPVLALVFRAPPRVKSLRLVLVGERGRNTEAMITENFMKKTPDKDSGSACKRPTASVTIDPKPAVNIST